MKTLSRGQKIRLTELTSVTRLQVRIELKANGFDFDLSCFGLDESGQLSDDRYFIFFNQKKSPKNEIVLSSLSSHSARFELDLVQLPNAAHRLVFVATVDGAGQMSGLQTGHFIVSAGGKDVSEFAFAGTDFSTEKAVMIGEIYFKNEWRIAANGQGFKEGLDAVLKRFGGQVQPEPAAPAAPLRPARPSGEPTPRPDDSNGLCCVRCGKNEGFLGQWLGINALDRSTRRCKACESEIKAAFDDLREDFRIAWKNGVLSTSLWAALWTRFENARTGASRSQALEFLRPDALQFMERLVAMAVSDGIITPTKESYVRQMGAFLELPGEMQAPFLARLEHVKKISAIREGHLPRISSGETHLDAGEICHLNVDAIYDKVNTRSISQITGRLMATSKKLVFLSPSGGWTIQFKNIMSAQATTNSVHLELSTRSGNGRYSVADSQWCEAVVTTLTRMAKRQLLTPQSDNPTRHIPQNVKNAVWQRDGGQCAQCKAISYLEFDHIIPHSKGGANTVGNVQLLCRGCNGAKGDRI